MAETIIRARHDRDNPYVITNRAGANDERLSWEARGMLWYFLSQKDDWQIWPQALINRNPTAGKDKVYRILKELELAGYITQQRIRNEAGRIVGTQRMVYEEPQHTDQIDRTLLGGKRSTPKPKKPYPEKPHPAEPDTANPPHSNYSLKVNNNHHQLSDAPQSDASPSAADAAGGGGDDQDEGTGDQSIPKRKQSQRAKHVPPATPAQQALRRYGVVSQTTLDELADVDVALIEAWWAAIVADPKIAAANRAGALVLRLRAGTAPATTTAPQAPTRPKAPYTLPEYATWTDAERAAAMARYDHEMWVYRHKVDGGRSAA